jgi:hypothetical protein
MIKKIVTNLYFLVFLNGVLLTSLYFFKEEDLYERDLFNAIVKNVKSSINSDNKDTFLLQSLKMTYELLHERQAIFENAPIATIDGNFSFYSVRKDLMAAKGACGSNAKVLARILKANDCDVRIGQMLVNNKYGGHIVVETKINNRWIIVDPLYNLYFTNPDGSLASFKQVNSNWEYFKKQVPQGYNYNYNYAGIRYANWNKIPILTPLIKKSLDLIMGKDAADHLSIRPKVLRVHHFLFVFGSWFYAVLSLFTFWLIYKRQKV